MISDLIFNADTFSGNILWIDNIQSTGGRVSVYSHLDVRDDLNVGENTQLSGTLHVDQDAVLKSKLYVEDDLNVGENTQLSGTLHVDQDAVLKSKLYVEDDLNVGENTQLSGTLHVDQDAVFRSGLFVEGNAQINGNLYVSGDRVIMETSTVRVEDKNIELAVLDSATDTTADQGGITLKGTTDKTILWSNATDSWDLSENLGIADGKYIFSDKLRARDSAGLSLEDDGGNGIFIEDGGNIGINTTSPSDKLDINGNLSLSNNSKIRWKDSLGNPKDTLRVDDKDELLISNNTTGNGGNIIFRSKAGFGESMTIDADGNVGIGTTDPSGKLHVKINSATPTSLGRFENPDGQALLQIKAKSDSYSILEMADAEDGNVGAVWYDHSNNSMRFKTNDSEKVRILSNGNVGIGTTNPIAPLTVYGANDTTFDNISNATFIGTDAYNSNAGAGIIFGGRYNSGNDVTTFGQISIIKENNTDGDYGGALTLGTRAAGTSSSTPMEKMRITSVGNVGIGITSPNCALHIEGNNNTRSQIRLRNTANTSDPADFFLTPVYSANQLQIRNSNAVPIMVMNGDGTVGIGNAVTSHKFCINAQLNNSPGGLFIDSSTRADEIDLINVRGDISTSNSTIFTVKSKGNVGIGTTSPNEKLDLNGILYLRNSTVPSTTTNRLYASGGNLFWNGQNVLDNVDTWRGISSTPANGATTTSISSDWAFDNVKTAVPANAVFTDTNTHRAISSTPTNGATTTSISSDWAFDNVKTAVPANAVFTDTVPTFSYNSTTKTLTITT